MEEYITKEEFESFLREYAHTIFTFDICIEVLAEKYCKVDKKEFDKFCINLAKNRIDERNKSKAQHMNELEKYSKKEE